MTETAWTVSELRALIRSIEWAHGTAFFFVVTEDLNQRESILRVIDTALATRRIRSVSIGSETTSVLDAVRDLSPFEERDVVFVTGLENAIRNERDTDAPVIRNLNATRDLFRSTFNGPVVFVVPPPVLTAISLGAPDFFSTRSGVYTIDAADERIAIPALRLSELATLALDDRSSSEREERIATLLESLRRLKSPGAELAYFEAAGRAVDLLIQVREWDTARQLAREAIDEADDWPQYLLQFSISLARIAVMTEERGEAEEWLGRAMELAQETADRGALLHVLELSAASQWNAGDLEGAEDALRRALELADELGDQRNAAIARRNIGLLYGERGRFGIATEWLRSALAAARRTEDEALIADVASSAAATFHRAGFTIEADELLLQNIDFLKRIGDAQRLAAAFSDLAHIRLQQKRLAEAADLFRRAFEHAVNAGAPPSHLLPYVLGLSSVAIAREDPADALRHFQNARHIVNTGFEVEHTPEARQRLAIAQGLVDEAVSALEKAPAQ